MRFVLYKFTNACKMNVYVCKTTPSFRVQIIHLRELITSWGIQVNHSGLGITLVKNYQTFWQSPLGSVCEGSQVIQVIVV